MEIFLQDLILQSTFDTADEQARSEIRAITETLNAQLNDSRYVGRRMISPSSTRLSRSDENDVEMQVSELIHNFLFPTVDNELLIASLADRGSDRRWYASDLHPDLCKCEDSSRIVCDEDSEILTIKRPCRCLKGAHPTAWKCLHFNFLFTHLPFAYLTFEDDSCSRLIKGVVVFPFPSSSKPFDERDLHGCHWETIA